MRFFFFAHTQTSANQLNALSSHDNAIVKHYKKGVLMTKTNTLTILLKREFRPICGAAVGMRVNINDIVSVVLTNGDSTEISIPKGTKELTLHAHAGIHGEFYIKDVKNVKTIILRPTVSDVECRVEYNDGKIVWSVNKFSANNANSYAIQILLAFLIIVLWFVFVI